MAAQKDPVCHWWEDGHGGRYLIPGCMTRINNPDVDECACPSIERQLEKAQKELVDARRALAGLQSWHDAIYRAVHDHRDAVAIMKAAADLAERGYGRRAS